MQFTFTSRAKVISFQLIDMHIHKHNKETFFETLSKYNNRQNENTLTQIFVAMFNHCPSFRQAFIALVKCRLGNIFGRNSRLYAQSQTMHKISKDRRIIADAEIWGRNSHIKTDKRFATIEAKLGAPLSAEQAEGYSNLLSRKRQGAALVMLTKYGVDSELARRLPRRTAWITWSELADSIKNANRGSALDRFLREEFLKMLKQNDISFLEPLGTAEWKKISQLGKFSLNNSESLNFNAINAVRAILNRLVVLRDAGWSELSELGWTSYAKIRRYDDEEPKDVAVDVGFYQWKTKRLIPVRWIYLSLSCVTPHKLFIYGGWSPKRIHPAYEHTCWKTFYRLDPRLTRRMFSGTYEEAREIVKRPMAKALGAFRRSKFYKKS